MSQDPFAALAQRIGEPLGTSHWTTIDQNLINSFADVTGDHQWIHVDPERAQTDSPFGVTIAHGFLTLSLIPMLQEEIHILPSDAMTQVFNYGLDRLRFITPVMVDSRVRLHSRLLSVEEKDGGRVLVKTENTIEIEGMDKPALVAEMLAMFLRG